MNRIRRIEWKAIVRPLRVLFSTSLGQKSVMRSVIVKAVLDSGEFGLGEAPTSFVLKHETIDAIQAALKEIAPRFAGRPIDDCESEIPILRKQFAPLPMTVSGLETALFRAGLKVKGISEHRYWGGKCRRIDTDITLPFLTETADLDKWLKYAFRRSFQIYKLKVSGNLKADRQVLCHVCRRLDEHTDQSTLRIDGNQGYTQKSFLELIDMLDKERIRIELIEQPLPKNDYAGLKFIRKRSPVPIILDESVFSHDDLTRVIDQDLADGINIKLAKSGISESRKMILTAKRHKLKLMIGCMTETMVGLSAGIYCAAGSDAFKYIDLDGVYFLHHRNVFNGIEIAPPTYILNGQPTGGGKKA